MQERPYGATDEALDKHPSLQLPFLRPLCSLVPFVVNPHRQSCVREHAPNLQPIREICGSPKLAVLPAGAGPYAALPCVEHFSVCLCAVRCVPL